MTMITGSTPEVDERGLDAAYAVLSGRHVRRAHRRRREHRFRDPRLPRRGRAEAHPDDGVAVPPQRRVAQTLLGGQPPRLGDVRRAPSPNAGHRMLATLENAGLVNGVVTQNVDGLHVRAGSRRVVDLHGSMDRVHCLDCGQTFARSSIAARIDRENPWLVRSRMPSRSTRTATPRSADVDDFVAPDCSVCGGPLKPDVVFFGEFVPTDKFAEARDSSARPTRSSSPGRRSWSTPASACSSTPGATSCRSSSSTAARRRATGAPR